MNDENKDINPPAGQEATVEAETNDNANVEIEPTAEVPQEPETQTAEEQEQPVEDLDLYEKARQENEALKAQLKEIEASDANVFAQNEDLKKQIADAQRIKEISAENAKLQAELTSIKHADLIANMTSNGQLSPAMHEWAQSQSYENLEAYAKIAPKQKTIIHQKNPMNEETDIAKKFREEQNRGRIL